MWLIVSKPTQLLAATRLWRGAADAAAGAAAKPWPELALYCFHLALGDAWNNVFFGQQRIALGCGVISAFFVALVASAAAFARLDPTAGLLMLPTCAWVSVAASLNWAIYFKNKRK
jgi:tryptophan-rich sensory protein